ncbi:hypothetical protein NDU88_006302 [Pleurodeles waltl]|uniref:Uncharacterized protein n=1 Tax=Pleurodeles waltl TaxID=8319 RepID=A0AAV7X148_PLEWA|nr:hypothetical protein NDU88_006302 [Pleurodeles waltl]
MEVHNRCLLSLSTSPLSVQALRFMVEGPLRGLGFPAPSVYQFCALEREFIPRASVPLYTWPLRVRALCLKMEVRILRLLSLSPPTPQTTVPEWRCSPWASAADGPRLDGPGLLVPEQDLRDAAVRDP